jgi:hypothetical protein
MAGVKKSSRVNSDGLTVYVLSNFMLSGPVTVPVVRPSRAESVVAKTSSVSPGIDAWEVCDSEASLGRGTVCTAASEFCPLEGQKVQWR